jgi:hypothetical protein
MIGYYVLAFDGDLWEKTLYPAVWHAYYENEFTALQRLAGEYPLLGRYLDYARTWTRRGCVRPLKHYTTGICEHNTKSPGRARLDAPAPTPDAAARWAAVVELLECKGRCSLIGVRCGTRQVIHPDLVDLCRYKTAGGAPWELGTPAQRAFIHAPPADRRYATFVDLVAGALAAAVAVPPGDLGLLHKLAAAFRADLELHYTGDQTGFLGYLTAAEARQLHSALAGCTLADSVAAPYLECLRGFLHDAQNHGSGLVFEVA